MPEDHTLEQLMDALHEYAEEVAQQGDYTIEEVEEIFLD